MKLVAGVKWAQRAAGADEARCGPLAAPLAEGGPRAAGGPRRAPARGAYCVRFLAFGKKLVAGANEPHTGETAVMKASAKANGLIDLEIRNRSAGAGVKELRDAHFHMPLSRKKRKGKKKEGGCGGSYVRAGREILLFFFSLLPGFSLFRPLFKVKISPPVRRRPSHDRPQWPRGSSLLRDVTGGSFFLSFSSRCPDQLVPVGGAHFFHATPFCRHGILGAEKFFPSFSSVFFFSYYLFTRSSRCSLLRASPAMTPGP